MKERILTIAIRQMRRGGYDNLNFADIAQELGTSRANLHHHFTNKIGLATAATKAYIQDQREYFDGIISANDGDLSGFLAELEEHMADMVDTGSSSSGCILSQLLNDREAPSDLRQLALDRLQIEVVAIQTRVEKAKADGTLSSSTDAENLAFRIMSMMVGIAQMSLIGADPAKVRSSIEGALVAMVE